MAFFPLYLKKDLNIFSFCCQCGSKYLNFPFNSWILQVCLNVAAFLLKVLLSKVLPLNQFLTQQMHFKIKKKSKTT